MDSLAHVNNYKTILKSAGILMKMMAHAQSLGVDIDDDLMDTINKQHQRLISERDLRNEIAIIDVPMASHESVKVLNDRIKDASEKSVEDEYLQKGQHLSSQMQGNLKAREVLKMLQDYPIREYPEPEETDPKKKTKEDPKKKKKKKREPPFPYPTWAEELEAVEQQIKLINSLIKNAAELQLSPDFLADSKEQLARFKQEVGFRKQQEEDLRLEAEAKALAKKKK